MEDKAWLQKQRTNGICSFFSSEQEKTPSRRLSLSHDPSSLPLNLNKKKPFYFSFPHPKNMARLSIAALLFALLALVAGAAFAHRELQSEFPFFLFSFFLALSLFLLRR